MLITFLIYPHFWITAACKSLPDNHTEMDILDLYLTDEFYDLIVLETNRYAKQYFKDTTGLPKYSRARQWRDVDKTELHTSNVVDTFNNAHFKCSQYF